MNITEAIDALRPFTSKVPSESLDYLRAHWEEAEQILLAEIERNLIDPTSDNADALFLYAIHLCAEMRCAKAFPHFVRIARLPNIILDHVLGDILTETFPQMLARTCDGRVDEIKALVEDPAVNDFARGSALQALMALAADGKLDHAELSAYCIELLSCKLERRASNVWDTAVSAVCELGAPGALPLIRMAYARGWADPGMASLENMISVYNQSRNAAPAQIRGHVNPFRTTESEMRFFVGNWKEDEDDNNQSTLLEVLDEREKDSSSYHQTKPSVGRNSPCPCGSGKKYKKCCLDKPSKVAAAVVSTVLGNPVRDEFVAANDWMEAGYRYMEKGAFWRAFECWRNCWDELRSILPESFRDPGVAEEKGVFEGCDFLSNWLQDFEMLLDELSERNLTPAQYAVAFFDDILRRFPALDAQIKRNMQVAQARCLSILGETEKAAGILEAMVAQSPESAQGYVELANLYGLETERSNMIPDIPRARRYLQDALENARDCAEYDVTVRLNDLDVVEESMRRPLP